MENLEWFIVVAIIIQSYYFSRWINDIDKKIDKLSREIKSEKDL